MAKKKINKDIMFVIVEKDIENELGFVHKKKYNYLKDAKKEVKKLKEELGTEYYDIFIAEVEHETRL